MGSGLVYHLGQLKFVDSTSASTSLNTSLVTYLAGGVGGAISVIVFVIVVVFMRKSRQSARAVQHMRNQMDVLEARVAKECKEGEKYPTDLLCQFLSVHFICCAMSYFCLEKNDLALVGGFDPCDGWAFCYIMLSKCSTDVHFLKTQFNLYSQFYYMQQKPGLLLS